MIPTLILFLKNFLYGTLQESWAIFEEAAPYLLFGFGVAGLLNVLVPDTKIAKYLGFSAGKIRSVINASLAGLPLPLCSCGVIPAAMSLKKRGANRGATLAFLISTPETGVDSIAITYALLDPLMTVFRPLAALATAILAGVAENLLIGEGQEKTSGKISENPAQKVRLAVQASSPISSLSTLKPMPCSCGCEPVEPVSRSCGCGAAELKSVSCSCESGHDAAGEQKSLKARILGGLEYAYIDLLGDLSKWILIGIFCAGMISYAVPEEVISNYLGGGVYSMLIMLAVGIPLYICATASTPLAAALVAKGMSPGTAFVFLLSGPATNTATITMVARFLGKKSAALYVGVIALSSLGFGLLLDFLYLKSGITASATIGSAADLLPENVKLGFALILLPLLLYGLTRKEECHV